MSYYEKRIAELEARVAQLAREQRMKAIPVEAKLLERYAVMQADNSRLKAEVKRLRKAGDELSWAFAFAVSRDDGKESGLIKAWNAAKEGKQS
jgi:uncharacterized small protein (DUF1192 family)